jgi:hypothetical protein
MQMMNQVLRPLSKYEKMGGESLCIVVKACNRETQIVTSNGGRSKEVRSKDRKPTV